MDTDHINGDKLDNRRANLRICTRSINLQNKPYAKNKSGYRGVFKEPKAKRWFAYIFIDKKMVRLGRFDTPELAYEARKEAVKRIDELNRFNV